MDDAFSTKWVDVVLPHPPFKQLTYAVPQRFRNALKQGQRVLVPVGRRRMTAFVTAPVMKKPDLKNIRELDDLINAEPLLSDDLMHLTRWTSEYYLASWGEVIRTALPPGILQKDEIRIHKLNAKRVSGQQIGDLEQRILTALPEERPILLPHLERRIKQRSIRAALLRLEEEGRIRLEHVLAGDGGRPRTERWMTLKSDITQQDLDVLAKRAPRQAQALQKLANLGGDAPCSALDTTGDVIRRLEQKGRVETRLLAIDRDAYSHVDTVPSQPVTLTDEQTETLRRIDDCMAKGTFHAILLYGVTGSGKTQIYIEAIGRALAKGKSALVLIPEISLTPQAVQRYRSHFGSQVAVLHSRMSAGERADAWRRLHRGEARIALGARSAVFAPLNNVGLIVVDEEQDSSYKQTDPSPRYHARDLAVMRARLNQCVVILGSATPSLESFWNARQGKYILCHLSRRIDNVPMPEITLMAQPDPKETGASRIFSVELEHNIKVCLDRGEQTILLQNRRGFATFLRCSACGRVEECPNCDLTLTYHLPDKSLRCHTCGLHKTAPSACPECGGATLRYRGVGTQRVEEELRRLFPHIRCLRMDLDTTRRKRAHDDIITAFEQGDGDVLLGTQMVAKGHDFPGVQLVGVISADTGLLFPDFRSGERTFQLLTQAAGRAGRRQSQGKVVIQTRAFDHPVLQFAASHDYEGYYTWEANQRRELGYPPWGRLIAVRFRARNADLAGAAAEAFCKLIPKKRTFDVLGPAPAPVTRIKTMHRFQIIFRASKSNDPSGAHLRKQVAGALSRFPQAGRFRQVYVAVDVDPVEML